MRDIIERLEDATAGEALEEGTLTPGMKEMASACKDLQYQIWDRFLASVAEAKRDGIVFGKYFDKMVIQLKAIAHQMGAIEDRPAKYMTQEEDPKGYLG